MKLRATITLDWEINGANGVKDFDAELVAQVMERNLNDYEDGRHNLALETLQALIRHVPKAAIYEAMSSIMFKRYGNRMYSTGPDSRSSAACYLAGKRTESITAYGPSLYDCVKVTIVNDDD